MKKWILEAEDIMPRSGFWTCACMHFVSPESSVTPKYWIHAYHVDATVLFPPSIYDIVYDHDTEIIVRKPLVLSNLHIKSEIRDFITYPQSQMSHTLFYCFGNIRMIEVNENICA